MAKTRDFDVVIIGSGFGGSVAALRLTEKGYRVAVLEAGRRFTDKDFPKTSWRLSKFLFLPRLGLRGIQRLLGSQYPLGLEVSFHLLLSNG